MALVKVSRQPILGQQVLGIDGPGMPAILRPGDSISFATVIMRQGPYIGKRSDHHPFYDYALHLQAIQRAYTFTDALNNIYKIPGSLVNVPARPQLYNLGPGYAHQIRGAIVVIQAHGNDNSVRDYSILYGTNANHYAFTIALPRDVGFTTFYVAPSSFATWYNTNGPQAIFTIGNTSPIDYIDALELHLFS